MQHGDGPLVALVEDEASICEAVGFALRREGYRVATYHDGEDAWKAFQTRLPDLVILDIIMPRMDGLELCRRLRAVSESLPVMFLSSRNEEIDRVLGLELGADDYLCKPFSVRELLARVKVLFRRASPVRSSGAETDPERPIVCGPLTLDPLRHTALWGKTAVALTVTEFRVLQALARQPGLVRSREQLLREGYPHDEYMSDRNIDGHIKRIRRKFSQADPRFDGIETIYGLGYRYRP
jgi:two-component system response regulator ChvI